MSSVVKRDSVCCSELLLLQKIIIINYTTTTNNGCCTWFCSRCDQMTTSSQPVWMPAGRSSRELLQVGKSLRSFCSGSKHFFELENACRENNFCVSAPGLQGTYSVALRESHTCREAVQQSPLKTKLKSLSAQTYQNKDCFLFAIPFLSKEASNKGSFFLNYIDFYNDCRVMSILCSKSQVSPSLSPPN